MELNVSWDQWKNLLSTALNAADTVGMSEDRINDLAYRVGDFLANKIDPGNREQKLLNELWSVASEEEQRILTRLIVRVVEDV